jgi:WhiB family redox-sensing transcriptional regulator
MSVDPEAWRADAACHGYNVNLWFPERGKNAARAKVICAGCPSKEPCLNYALDNYITHGIFGGLDERGRRSVKRIRRNRPVRHVAGQPVSMSTYNNHGCRCEGCLEAVHTWRNNRVDRSASVSAPVGAPSRSVPLAADPGSPPRTARAGGSRRPDDGTPSPTSSGRGTERAARRSVPHSLGGDVA